MLSYHQMDNGCAPTAQQCAAAGFNRDSVTQRQFYEQMSWLHSHGYQTITAEQYVTWSTAGRVMLPAKPVLLTVDDGIANFYAGATPVLRHFGFTMVSMVVSGFAQGAQDGVRQYKGWDAGWAQLGNLPASTWQFAFHAGPDGHTLTSGTGCQYFYPCQRAGESAAAYKARVTRDIDAGLAEPGARTCAWCVYVLATRIRSGAMLESPTGRVPFAARQLRLPGATARAPWRMLARGHGWRR